MATRPPQEIPRNRELVARGDVLDAGQRSKLAAEPDVLSQLNTVGVRSQELSAVRAAAAMALRPAPMTVDPSMVGKREGGDLAERSGKRRREDRAPMATSRAEASVSPHNFFSTISNAASADAVLDVLEGMPGGMTSCTAASLAHALHVLARKRPTRHTQRVVAVLRACSTTVSALALRGLSKLYWAVSQLYRVAPEQGPVRQAAADLLWTAGDHTTALMPTFDARGVVTVLHSHATVDLRVAGGLGTAALDRLEAVATTLSGQDVANCWWALAKLKLGREGGHMAPLRAATSAMAPALKPQELSMTLWAMATLGSQIEPDFAAVLAKSTIAALPRSAPQGVANISWAWARFEKASPELVAILGETVVKTISEFTAQGLSAALWSCAKLGCSKKLILNAVKTRGVDVVSTMNQLELTNLAWALATVRIKRTDVLRAIGERSAALRDTADWQLVGHLQHFDRATDRKMSKVSPDVQTEGGENVPFRKWLRKLGRTVLREATSRTVDLHYASLDRAISAARPWDTPDFCSRASKAVLLVNVDSEFVETALEAKSLQTVVWNRASTQGTRGRESQRGRPWPMRGSEVGECIARISHFRAATEMMLDGITTKLEHDGALWLIGTAAEGIHAARQLLSKHFKAVMYVPELGDTTFAILHATGFCSPETPRSLDSWRKTTTLQLSGQSLAWVTYPGLFANGELDVMTSALLAAIPRPPNGAKVLDVCCGSGTIAAALLLQNPTIVVELLDNDAVAVKAAKRNVEDAAAIHLLSGIQEIHALQRNEASEEAPVPYDWIVSNPPVHRGLDSEFSVLEELVHLGPACLAPGGRLYIVTQTYVPVESLSTKSAKLVPLWTDGRFTVWSHTREL